MPLLSRPQSVIYTAYVAGTTLLAFAYMAVLEAFIRHE